MPKIRKETRPNRRQINTALAALHSMEEGKKSIQDISPETEKKGQLGRRRRPWEEYIKMDIGEMEYECVGWSHLIRYWDQGSWGQAWELKAFLKRHVVSCPYTQKLLLALQPRVCSWRLNKQNSPPYAADYVKLFRIQMFISLYETRDMVNQKKTTKMKPRFLVVTE